MMNTIAGNGQNGQSAPLTLTLSHETPTVPAENFDDWRRAAMLDALQCRERDGSPEYTILRTIQRQLPQHATRVFNESRVHTEAAFRRLIPDLTAYCAPSLLGEVDVPIATIYGWWRGVWPEDGQTYEIALSPSHYNDGDWVVAGPTVEGTKALAQAALDWASRDAVRCQIFSMGSWTDAPELVEEVKRTTWDDIVLPASLLADVRGAVDGFFESEAVFRRMNFAWRRGVLLVGPPGTGKTMVCRAVASSRPEMPFLYVRDLGGNGRGGRDMLAAIFNHARRLAPCILAIEDMDGLIGKENRTMLLNELDGFKKNDGILLIASSNHPEKIDEALLKRPSRFDRVYHVGLPAQTERETYARLLLERAAAMSEGIAPAPLAERIAATTSGFTPALIKEAILSALLERAQAGMEGGASATTETEDFEAIVARQIEWLRKYLKKANDPLSFSESIGESGEIGFRSR